MIPNNNLSVLPWYTSIEQQNARKWWTYGKIYPLFTPAGFLLPFQIMRNHRLKFTVGSEITPDDYDVGYLAQDGKWMQDASADYGVSSYDVTGKTYVYFDVPAPFPKAVVAVAKNNNGDVLGIFNPKFITRFVGGWPLPEGTTQLFVQTRNRTISATDGKVNNATAVVTPVEQFKIYTKDGTLLHTLTPGQMGFSVVPFVDLGYDVIVFPGKLSDVPQMENGQYYAVLSDGVETWYSEIFTVVNDIQSYLKLEWWDVENFVMDAGVIVYEKPAFKNVLYLCADIAKPEYTFEEEDEARDGYFFPVKQISKKRYHFSFLASEYLLDVMRFIRMADFAQITKNGQTYSLDTFLITPEWENNGDVASVEAEFDTATVAKKIGVGYIKAKRGDFNNDYNNDYHNNDYDNNGKIWQTILR